MWKRRNGLKCFRVYVEEVTQQFDCNDPTIFSLSLFFFWSIFWISLYYSCIFFSPPPFSTPLPSSTQKVNRSWGEEGTTKCRKCEDQKEKGEGFLKLRNSSKVAKAAISLL